MFVFCCVSSANKTKAQLPIYSLFNRFELTCIYMETMATTSESADKSTTSEVFECRKIRGQHIILILWLQHVPITAYAMASLVKFLLVKGFGIVNDRTDTYLILNTQSCGLLLEPRLDLMAPETVCLIMQTLYKSTLNEAFIIRQIVDAVVLSKNLLPPVKT